MRLANKDVVGGLSVVFIGIVFLAGALKMRIGDAIEMGPGYFPMLASIIAIVLGLAITLVGLVRASEIEKPEWGPAMASLGSVFAFGALLETTGLILATAACVAIAAMGDLDFRKRETLWLAVGTAIGSWLLFRVLLGLQMPGWVIPAFLTR